MSESWNDARLAHRGNQSAAIATGALVLITDHGAPALTMAAIARQAEVSRQTLYRYYRDVDAVLIGVAELVTSHDQEFERLVAEHPNPSAQLDFIAHTIATSGGHDTPSAVALAAVVPPAARDVLTRHEANIIRLVSTTLRRGVDDGSFRRDLDPDADAPLILGLLVAADSNSPDRALTLIHRLVKHANKGANT